MGERAQLLMDDKQIKAARDSVKENPDTFSVEEVICNVMHHTIRVGDIFLEDVRRYREKMLAGTGIRPLFPLWQVTTDKLAAKMVSAGLPAPCQEES